MGAASPIELVTKSLEAFPSLRYYQRDAVHCAAARLRKTREPILIVMPTGSGKSWVIAALAAVIREMTTALSGKSKKVLVLAPSCELVGQNHEKMVSSGFPATLYSGGLSQYDSTGPIVFGSPLTVINATKDFEEQGLEFTAVFVDEAHSTTPTVKAIIGDLRRKNSNLRVVGLTATPYRLGKGYIYRKDQYRDREPLSDRFSRDPYYAEMVYDIPPDELIDEGYLIPPVLGDVADQYDTSKLKRTKTGHFTEDSGNRVYVDGRSALTKRIVQDVKRKSKTRRGVMFFAQNIKHANLIMSFLPKKQAHMIDSNTPERVRARLIAEYKKRKFKYMVNVGTLTTGFDAPHVDCIAVLRKTESMALFQQIIGRGFRLCPETKKVDCLVLDYGQNIPPDGDIFTPAIQAAMPGNAPERTYVEVQCPACRSTNTFQKAKWPDGTVINDHGYLVIDDEDTGKSKPILTELGKPIAGHFGVQCTAYIAKKGRDNLTRCQHTWGSVECPNCHVLNSKRQPFCRSCEEPLSKGAKQLQARAGSTRQSAYAHRLAEVHSWKVLPSRSRNGIANLRIVAEVQEPPYFETVPPDEKEDLAADEIDDGLILRTPDPETITFWLNPLVSNYRAQSAWQAFFSFASANLRPGQQLPDNRNLETLVDVLGANAETLLMKPAYLIYRQQPPRDGVTRTFHEAISYHSQHPHQ